MQHSDSTSLLWWLSGRFPILSRSASHLKAGKTSESVIGDPNGKRGERETFWFERTKPQCGY